MIFVQVTFPLFVSGDYSEFFIRALVSTSNDIYLILASSWAFFGITAFQIVWHRPVIQALQDKFEGKPLTDIAKSRLIQGPLVLAVSTLFGWETSSLLSSWRLSYLMPEFMDSGLYSLTAILFGTWGVFIFAFCYFVSDYCTRTIFLPYLMPDGGVGKFFLKNGFSILKKLILYWFSISFFPVLVIYLAYLNANHSLSSKKLLSDVFWQDPLFIIIFILLVLSFVLSFILGKVFQTPLEALALAARRIQNQDFSTKVFVHSSDELGVLGDSFNEMAVDLLEKEKIKSSFGKFVDPRIRDYILGNNLNLGGQIADATILFCDLRGFTSLSERSSPEKVVSLLNEYFSLMTEEIEKYEGYVNKFIGDSILAVFGTPFPVENHANKALNCALAMERALAEYNGLKGLNEEKISMGIGIHSGSLLCGNIGSSHRLEFTVIGDTVNTASRVEGLSKTVGKTILLTDKTYQALSQESKELCQRLGSYALRGKESEEILYFAVAKTSFQN